jgi:alkylation response protein AidB-like acyl-CoA dehydrogenase
MDLELSADQMSLRDGIISLLDAKFPIERVRNGFDRALFDELAAAGVFTLRRDGFSWADCVVVLEQLGRYCVPGPLVPSLLLGDGRVAGYASGIFVEPIWVEHLGQVDVVVVDDHPLGLLDARDVEFEPSPWPLDPLTPVGRVTKLPARESIAAEHSEWQVAGATLTAALQLGLADRLTELAVAYAKERVQFDRPIGSFQAIKHICADMIVRTEVARAAVYAAGARLDEGTDRPGFDRLVSGAKLVAGEAAIANGKAATQVFGGMGFTWEVDVHLYLKRAWVLDTHFGPADQHATFLASAASR